MYKITFMVAVMVCALQSANAQSTLLSENLKPREFQEKLKSSKEAVLLDVRTPDEVKQGIIPGAVNIDYRSPDFKEHVSKLDKNKTYFVYCAAGGRSSKTVDLMEDLGFKKVYNLDGGMEAWQDEDLPTEKK